MTTNQVRTRPAETVDEQAVVQFLHQNPGFFEQHPQLLGRMRLQHARNASTISLIERQVEVLREKIQTQEEKLAQFVRVAHDNNVLADKFHAFTRRLLRVTSAEQAVQEIEAGLREHFAVTHARLVLPAAMLPQYAAQASSFVRRVAADDPLYRSFDGLFVSGKPRCGQVRDSQGEFLFGTEALGIASIALLPLGAQAPHGLLALGSLDRQHFQPEMSTDFLARMGELISEVLARA